MKSLELANVDTQRWYVAYTLPRHEKAVAHRLWIQKISSYVPLYTEERHWHDRRLKVELPLFPGYVFVRMAFAERVTFFRIPESFACLPQMARSQQFRIPRCNNSRSA